MIPVTAAPSMCAQACLNLTLVPLQPIENVGWGRPTRLRVTRHNDTFSKLYLFGVQAKRLVFLDADAVVLRNIDTLFDPARDLTKDDPEGSRPAICCPGGRDASISAVPDLGYACGTSKNAGVCRHAFARGDQFNSGVMVVRPSRALFEDLFVRRWTTSSMDGGDQGLLNALARGWGDGPGRLPFRYNTFANEELIATQASLTGKRSFDLGRVSILHFSGLKPWSRGSRSGKIGPKSLHAFDRAMASYRRRCLGTGRSGSMSGPMPRDTLLKDILLARRARAGKSSGGAGGPRTRIHLHEFYGA